MPPSTDTPSSVSLDASAEPLRLRLSATAPFEVLRADLRALLESTEGLKGRHAHLELGERELVVFDLRRLLHLLMEHGVHVVAVRASQQALRRFAERELKVRLLLDEDEPEAGPDGRPPEPAPEPRRDEPRSRPISPEGGLQVVRRTLRSGSSVRAPGDLLVYGDVNPGAELVAGGNVLVMGALKGMAHAGARGDEGAFVLALSFQPTQLRIASLIAIPPDEAPPRRSAGPEIAYVREGRIVIEPYRGLPPAQRSPA